MPFTQLRVEITFAQTPKLVPKDNVAVGDEVMGYVEFDTDDNVATGTTGNYNLFCGGIPMGVNFGINLFTRNANGDYPIFDNTGAFTGDVATPTVVDNTIVLSVQLSKFGGDDGATKMGMVLGNGPGPTDCAPNDNTALYTTRPRRTAW